MDTLTKSCSPSIVITASGEVQTHEEATVYVKELDIFLTIKVLENTPAVLSLGKLCDENGYSYEWINGQKPHLIKNGLRIPRNTENFVPIVVPGLSNSSSGSSSTSRTLSRQESHYSTSSSTSPPSPTVGEMSVREREDALNSDISPVPVSELVDDRTGQPDKTTIDRGNSLNSEIPQWLQEFREILVDDEIPLQGGSHASSSHEVSLEPTTERREDFGKHNVYTHFPEDRNCEMCKKDQNYKGTVQKTQWWSRTSCWKFWWNDNSKSQGPKRQLRISKQSPISSRGAGSSHSMEPSISMQKQNFTRNPEKLAKVPGTREETTSHLHWQFHGIWQGLWRSLLESLHVYTTQIRNKCDCWKSSAQSKKRHLCCIVAIRSEWKLVGRFHGTLYLSAKRHRSIIWW